MKKRKIILTKEYYEARYLKILNQAGARYSPETNVELPLADVFNGLCRTKSFYDEIRKISGSICRGQKYVKSDWEKNEINRENIELRDVLRELHKTIGSIKEYSSKKIEWHVIAELTIKADNLISSILSDLYEFRRTVQDTRYEGKTDNSKLSAYERAGATIHYLQELHGTILELNSLSTSSKGIVSNRPCLLIRGDAGIGKTHFLCDQYQNRTKDHENPDPTFLSLGEEYRSSSDFWRTFLENQKLIQYFKDKTAFLKYIDGLAQDNQCRSLIMIDALNESSADFWKTHLTSLLDDISAYQHVALVITIRTGFEHVVLSGEQIQRFKDVTHTGFANVEWQAVTKYFEQSSITLPEIPILYPEFQNPLFVKIFCQAYKKRIQEKPKKELLRGHEGSTYIFEQFVDNVSKPLAKKHGLGSRTNQDVWNSIIKPMAKAMVKAGTDRINESELISIINRKHPHIDASKLIQDMEKELLITRYIRDDKTGNIEIKFPFQKFSDHLIVRYIFNEYEHNVGKKKDIHTAKQYFSPHKWIGKIISNGWNNGLIEALSIQCPERLKGIEFIEIACYLLKHPHTVDYAIIAFINSIVWRKSTAFGEDLKNTLRIINKYVINDENMRWHFFDALLTVAPIEEHPYNALCLDQYLKTKKMQKRDVVWSSFLHYYYNGNSSIDRVLTWVFIDNPAHLISEDSLCLIALALSWFLTTTDRSLRDRATKGLARLFIIKPTIILKLLVNFEQIDDIYITERLYAAAYSCALHGAIDENNLDQLARYIYRSIFSLEEVPKHILLRDYARGIIEIALSMGLCNDIDKERINPPYKSKWPQSIPSEDELKQKYCPDKATGDKNQNQDFSTIWYSVMSFGDFARYIIGTNSNTPSWMGRKIDDNLKPIQQIYDEFLANLSLEQKEIWDSLAETNLVITIKPLHAKNTLARIDTEPIIEAPERIFINSLTTKQQSIYLKHIKPNITPDHRINDPHRYFDLSIAQRWVFKRVIDLGFNPSIHNEFDFYISRGGSVVRSERKVERIGKKYQWIAYYEFMGMLSDNYQFREGSWSGGDDKYSGPWEPHLRDIDPTLLIQNDLHIERLIPLTNWKSNACVVNNWHVHIEGLNWLRIRKDIPKLLPLIEVNDDNSNKWLLLNADCYWKTPTPPEKEKFVGPEKSIYMVIKSYLIKKLDIPKIKATWEKKKKRGDWRPDPGVFYEIFLGEYPYSHAYECTKASKDDWERYQDTASGIEIPMLAAFDCYLNEFTNDCSYDRSSIEIRLPCATIIKGLNLKQKSVCGMFYEEEKLVSSPISIFKKTEIVGLLFDRETLTKYLNENCYTIVWHIYGEKRVFGPAQHSPGLREIMGLYWLDDFNRIDRLCKTF